MTADVPTLESRLRVLSAKLCSALAAVILEGIRASASGAAGVTARDELRPVQLTSQLGLNKSLASRVVRALREKDELRALLGIPTPQGLQLIERAARKMGASEASLDALQCASGAYSDILGEFSGGRTDLEATLAGWIPGERERAERDARRSVFRGMTTLAGTRTGAIYNSVYLIPSPDKPDRLDSLVVAVRQDVRRLQVGAKILVMSIRSPSSGGVHGQDRRTLDGGDIQGDPRNLILPDLCSHPIPSLSLDATASHALSVRIEEDALDVNEFTTLGFGWRTSGHFPRFANERVGYGQMAMRSINPTEALVMDLFVHEDLHLGGLPFAAVDNADAAEITTRLSPPPEGSPPRLNAPPVLHLDDDPSGLSSRDVRACKAIAENACREAGFEPGSFRKYRVRVEFPIQAEEVTIWWRLPAPESTD